MKKQFENLDKNVEHYFKTYHSSNKNRWMSSRIVLKKIAPDAKVLDFGCGGNIYKEDFKNLVGLDPYNDSADVVDYIDNYNPGYLFDAVLAMGSVNFISEERVLSDISKCLDLLKPRGHMYFRVAPALSEQGNINVKERAKVKWFQFTLSKILEFTNKFDVTLIDIQEDRQTVDRGALRYYFEWKKDE